MRPFSVWSKVDTSAVTANSRDSAREIAFALQMPKKSGRVPRSAAEKPRKDSADFFDFWREKVSEQELSDDLGTAHGPFLLSAKLQFRDSSKKAPLSCESDALRILDYKKRIAYSAVYGRRAM